MLIDLLFQTYVGHSNSGLCKQMSRCDKPMPIFSYIGFIEMAGSVSLLFVIFVCVNDELYLLSNERYPSQVDLISSFVFATH